MAEFKLYHYDPSFIAAVVFASLFTLSTLCHFYQIARFKAFFFIPFLVGCIFEAVGYAGRAISAKQTPDWDLMPYILQSILLLLGPTMMAASIYMSLGRLIAFLDAGFYSLIPVSIFAKTFLIGDILSFLAQSAGGGMLAQAETKGDQKMGQTMIIIGLVIQIYFFSFFMTVIYVFHRRMIKNPTKKSLSITTPWKRFITVLYAASGLIMVRSLFRMVEYIEGVDGELQSKEIYIYVFDAALMCVTTILFNVFHPGRVILVPKDYLETSNLDNDPASVPLRSTIQTNRTGIKPILSPQMLNIHHNQGLYSQPHFYSQGRSS
ncbi:hypothetical protein FDECE_11168 [Fusarium decemcellulare]|nr:hypothetical protein FDECE_11168 [Fusarium decemcellulare]